MRRSITNVQGSTEVYDAQCRVPPRRTDASPPLLQQAQTHGEWETVSHDATNKVLFSIIGQEPMAQREDEYHALHTVVGKTGAVPGAVALPSEGKQHVRTSIAEILPEPCRATTLWVFSDNPSTMLGCADVFPSLKGVAEGPLHLALRIERCFSGKRVAVSRLVLDLHRKFRAPHETEIYTGEERTMGVEGIWTNVVQHRDYSLRADWDNYCATPFRWHQEYINELTKIAQAHPEEMERVGTDKRTVLEVIMSGSAFQHYAYLMNGCQVMYELPAASRRTLAWGTAGNEAVHWQMKSWHANVRIQHGECVQRTMKVFSLVKMLTHNAAAYSPTLSQHSQGHVLSTIIGGIRRDFSSR